VLANAIVSAVMNFVLLAGLPFLSYFAYHKLRHRRTLREITCRAGLRIGDGRHIGYSAAFTVVAIAAIVLWPPPADAFVREGSPQRAFRGLGLGGPAIPMALLYGIVKTGFPEELLFRGLIAGSLARRVPLFWANLGQALIFLTPHLLILRFMPEMWGLLPLIFAGAFFLGWARIRSDSILGPWLIHASLNVATCLSVAVRTAPPSLAAGPT
jgi:membrane protease YdiL (CAAX protease family)